MKTVLLQSFIKKSVVKLNFYCQIRAWTITVYTLSPLQNKVSQLWDSETEVALRTLPKFCPAPNSILTLDL